MVLEYVMLVGWSCFCSSKVAMGTYNSYNSYNYNASRVHSDETVSAAEVKLKLGVLQGSKKGP